MERSGMSEKCFFVMIYVEIILLSKWAQNNAICTTVDKLPFWPNCALSDKSTKIGRGRFVCFELIRCGAIGPWSQWSVGASPMSKYGQ